MSSLGNIRKVEAFYIWDLLVEMVGRDLKLRYRRSVLGLLWTLLNPLAQLLVLNLVFRLVQGAMWLIERVIPASRMEDRAREAIECAALHRGHGTAGVPRQAPVGRARFSQPKKPPLGRACMCQWSGMLRMWSSM